MNKSTNHSISGWGKPVTSNSNFTDFFSAAVISGFVFLLITGAPETASEAWAFDVPHLLLATSL
jgi:hypothetical protein